MSRRRRSQSLGTEVGTDSQYHQKVLLLQKCAFHGRYILIQGWIFGAWPMLKKYESMVRCGLFYGSSSDTFDKRGRDGILLVSAPLGQSYYGLIFLIMDERCLCEMVMGEKHARDGG